MRSGVEWHCFSVKCGLPRHFKGCPCVLWEMGQRGKFLYVSYNGFAGWSPSLFYFKLAEANLAGTETPVSHRNASNKSHCFFATGKSESSVAFWKMPSKVCLGNRPSWQQINAVNKQINQRNAVVWKVDFSPHPESTSYPAHPRVLGQDPCPTAFLVLFITIAKLQTHTQR